MIQARCNRIANGMLANIHFSVSEYGIWGLDVCLVLDIQQTTEISHSSVEPGRGADEVYYFDRWVFGYSWHELCSCCIVITTYMSRIPVTHPEEAFPITATRLFCKFIDPGQCAEWKAVP